MPRQGLDGQKCFPVSTGQLTRLEIFHPDVLHLAIVVIHWPIDRYAHFRGHRHNPSVGVVRIPV